MADRLLATEKDIAKVCSYITDDGTVAGYFGVARERVARIRGKLKTVRFSKQSSGVQFGYVPEPVNDRDPCPRCGARGDVPCGHSRIRLGMVL